MNAFKMISKRPASVILSVLLGLIFSMQSMVGIDWKAILAPNLYQQWDGYAVGGLFSFLYTTDASASILMLACFAVLAWALEGAWGARSLVVQVLVVGILSTRFANVDLLGLTFGVAPCLGYLWAAVLLRRAEKMSVSAMEKTFIVLGSTLLWLVCVNNLGDRFGQQSDEIISMVMGGLFGVVVYWLARVLGWTLRGIGIRNLDFVPWLGLVVALSHWFFQAVQPVASSADKKMLWELDQGRETPDVHAWVLGVAARQGGALKQELALRCLLGMKMKCDPQWAKSELLTDTSINGAVLVKMGYLWGLEMKHAELLKKIEGSSKKSLFAIAAQVEIMCGSRDSSLLNPVKGAELAEENMALGNLVGAGLETPYAACLMKMGRRAEAEAWAFRGYRANQRLSAYSWLAKYDERLALDAYFRIRAGQQVYFPVHLKPEN